MLIGKVVGSVVSTRKDEELTGLKLLLVQGVDRKGSFVGQSVVCVDSVGAGEGEVVLFAGGSSARQTEVTKNRPVDHVIMAIVDEMSFEGQAFYRKDNGFV
jgi:microcompartment protein CcmK/EutM